MDCIDVPSDSVTVDTYLNWLPMLYISQVIDKVTIVFKFVFVETFRIDTIELHIHRWFMIETCYCDMNSFNILTTYIFKKT